MEQTVKCALCGSPYKGYSHTVADQSACQRCIRRAESMRGATPNEFITEGMRGLSEDEIKHRHLKDAEGMRNSITFADV